MCVWKKKEWSGNIQSIRIIDTAALMTSSAPFIPSSAPFIPKESLTCQRHIFHINYYVQITKKIYEVPSFFVSSKYYRFTANITKNIRVICEINLFIFRTLSFGFSWYGDYEKKKDMVIMCVRNNIYTSQCYWNR